MIEGVISDLATHSAFRVFVKCQKHLVSEVNRKHAVGDDAMLIMKSSHALVPLCFLRQNYQAVPSYRKYVPPVYIQR